MPGRHNIYNALAMCAVGRFVGLTVEQCAEAALNFKGAGRRFEVYGECNGALVIDDYAHHPTELRATLNTAKEMGYKRLIAVHQPFTYSRTKMLFNDFVDVLKIPDITVLTPIMGSREPNDPTITSAKLAARSPAPCWWTACRPLPTGSSRTHSRVILSSPWAAATSTRPAR